VLLWPRTPLLKLGKKKMLMRLKLEKKMLMRLKLEKKMLMRLKLEGKKIKLKLERKKHQNPLQDLLLLLRLQLQPRQPPLQSVLPLLLQLDARVCLNHAQLPKNVVDQGAATSHGGQQVMTANACERLSDEICR
jgi:hypothetical protein